MTAKLAKAAGADDSIFHVWVSQAHYDDLALLAQVAVDVATAILLDSGRDSPEYIRAAAYAVDRQADLAAVFPYLLTNVYPGVVIELDNTIKVDSEYVSVMFTGSGVISVQRGLLGTVRASHAAGTDLVIAPYSGGGGAGTTGPTGATGPAGATGQAGPNAWLAGSGNPSDVLGVDSDFYLDVSTGNVWQKDSGTWGV